MKKANISFCNVGIILLWETSFFFLYFRVELRQPRTQHVGILSWNWILNLFFVINFCKLVTFSFVVAFLYQQNLNHTICRRTNLNSLGCFYSKKKLTWQSCSWTFLYYIKDHHIIQIFDRKDLAQQQRVSWNFIYMTLYLYYYIYLWLGGDIEKEAFRASPLLGISFKHLVESTSKTYCPTVLTIL